MIKYILLTFNLVGLLLYKLLVADGLSITQTLPASVEVNKEYVVELTINKSNIQGFGKFQEDLPKGFSAEAIETKGGAFSFIDNSIKIIWMTLPGDVEFVVKYKIIIGADASGEHEISPKFSYFTGNEKTVFNAENKTIKVGGTPAVIIEEPIENKNDTAKKPSEPTNNLVENKKNDSIPPPSNGNKEAQKQNSADENAKQQNTGNVTCVRKIDSSNPKEILVEVTINKGELDQFGKLEESISEGFSATGIESKNAIFAFVDQKAKFTWMLLPSDEQIVVSYKIKPTQANGKTCTVEGLFSYLEDDVSKKNTAPAITLTFGNNENKINPEENNAKKEPENKVEPPIKTEKEVEKVVENKKQENEPKEPTLTNVPSLQKGILYRVQITATHKSVETIYFKDTYKINDEIFAEMHQGWYKYTLGSFNSYSGARDKRENVNQSIAELSALGPFVAAYNNGSRITVQEALMISGQTWIK